MDLLSIIIVIFMIMELSNVIILYFKPEFKYGNGVSVFNGWEKSKDDENMHNFVKYLVNWVAGVKLIFIVLLGAIVALGNEELKILAVICLIISIATYYFRLSPLIRKLDKNNEITPKGYSKTLDLTIFSFICVFIIGLYISLNRIS